MKLVPPIAAFAAALLGATPMIAQGNQPLNPAAPPPKFLVLVYQRFPFEKMADRDKWEQTTARICRNLPVPNSWIVMDSVTGEPEVLTFDPFDSFAHIGKAFAEWGPIYASNAELGKVQAQITGAQTSQRTMVAVKRDDLSYRPDRIDLSKARFMRVLEVRLHAGRENDFAEAFQALSAAYEKTNSDLPWVVYQVNLGAPLPAFYAFVPMRTLAQNDDVLNLRPKLREAEGPAADRMQEIAREAYASTESNLYVITPDKSVVSKEFAAGDPDFWTPKPPAKPISAPARKSNRKR